MAERGIGLEVVETAGSVENLKRLLASTEPGSDASFVVDLAFIQGGIATAAEKERLSGLGSMFYEPLWLFAPAAARAVDSESQPLNPAALRQDQRVGDLLFASAAPHLNRLIGARIGVGAEDSGTRPLALHLLRANGITADNATLVSQGLDESGPALKSGELDLVFAVGSADSPLLRRLAGEDGIVLQDLPRAAAYARRDGFISALELPAGTLDPANDIPAADLNLAAVTANLVATPDIHPALVDLLLEAASKVHGDGSLFAPAGTFPTPDHGDFPLHSDAERHYKYGPPLLQRYLPFWLATWIDRTKVMLLPLLVLLLPLLRTLPPVYRWRIRRRILRWHVELRRIDLDLEGDTPDSDRLAELARQLEGIESEAARVQVPLAYSDALYNLRLHIGLLEDKIARLRTASTTAGA